MNKISARFVAPSKLSPKTSVPALKLGLPVLVVCLFCVAYGFLGQKEWKNVSAERTVKIAGVQANIGSADKVAVFRKGVRSKMQETVERYLDLSKKAAQAGAELIVWPETAFPDYIIKRSPLFMQVVDAARTWNVDFLIGAFDHVWEGDKSFTYNGVFLFEKTTDKISEFYFKTVLLAFGEYVPFSKTFPGIKKLFPAVSDFSAGDGPKLILWNDIRLGTSICYEALISSFVRDLVKLKPQIMVNVTNDSWFGDTREPEFHLSLQAMRAIEHRIPLFRVANTGISALVTSYGEWSTFTRYNDETYILADVPVREPAGTIYERFGALGMQLLIAIGFAWVLWIIRQSLRQSAGR